MLIELVTEWYLAPCTSGRGLQCVKELSRCDDTMLCEDGSDFFRCPLSVARYRYRVDIPMIIDFRPKGIIDRRPLPPDIRSIDGACPETHFWCPDKDYCLPVYVRCNGVNDCPGHEDEECCDTYTCPGFYRCRASKVCVHIDHVCDDWPLCPQYDDELLCNMKCPSQCTCHGLAFFCGSVFAVHQYPDLRYLDVRGSGMNAHQLGDSHMLVHLSLARCGVKAVSNFSFPNLHSLDLSNNLLKEVCGDHFVNMPHLTVLFLAGNPITSVFTLSACSNTQLNQINMLDLSRVELHTVDSSLFVVFPRLHTLNLSHSGVELLHWNSSQMASLQELDLQGSAIAEFSRDVLKGCVQLQLLLTDNFKLCCPSVLPPAFDLNHCHTRQDDVSSCDGLLGSVYRGAVAVLAILSVLGNMASLTVRVCVRNTWQQSSGGVVLTHLSVADLGMGLYLATLGLADRVLAGHYLWQDVAWRRGAVCQLAGVLAMSCRHAATFFITILSLDRCLHSCGASTPRLMPTKVKVTCAVVWAASLVLTVVPLVSEWRFFGHQVLCVPLPHKRGSTLESYYAFGVMVLLHMAMFVFSSVCEVLRVACSKVRKSGVINTCDNVAQFLTFGSLTSGFLYTIACLVPTDSHTDRQMAIHTALVYFGCVVSCAMNPYLHLYGVRVERDKRIKEERLMRIVNRARVWWGHVVDVPDLISVILRFARL